MRKTLQFSIKHNIQVYLSILSLACLSLSLMIFSFKSLQCDRLRIHRNFMVSLVSTLNFRGPYFQATHVLYARCYIFSSQVLYGLLTILQFQPYLGAQDPTQQVWQVDKVYSECFEIILKYFSLPCFDGNFTRYQSDPWICRSVLGLYMFCFQVQFS